MVYETHEQMYAFTHLPRYATYLLEHRLEAYTREAIGHFYAVDVPLLKYFTHVSPEEIFQSSMASSKEFLSILSQGRAKQFIEQSIALWVNDQLPVVGKYKVEAKDITLINYVRAKTLKTWLAEYTDNMTDLLQLNSEIDDFFLGFNTTATNTYIQILKDRIEEEAHFSSNLITASPGIIFIYDLVTNKEVYINGRVEEVMGFTPQEVLDTPDLIAQHTHPDDMLTVLAFLQSVSSDRDGQSYQADYRFKNKQGRYEWLRCYAVVFKRNSEGVPTQVLGAAYEITREKETGRALQKREQQLLEAQAIGQIGSFEWDLVHDQSESSPELRKIFEANGRQNLGQIMAKVHPDDKEKLTVALAASMRTGDYRCEYRYLAPSGEKVIDSKGIVSFDAEGQPQTLTGTVQDVTLRKRAEESLVQKTLELERSNVQLQEFAYVASHDLKEPLRKISMFSNLLLATDAESLPEKTKANLQKIGDAALRMQYLIEGILSYSSLNRPAEKECISLEQPLKEALNNLESRIKDTNAVVTSDELPATEVVPFQMQQLFQNLIGNALKFSKGDEQPTIRITHAIFPRSAVKDKPVDAAESYLQIRVADNGIGFSPEAREKIFGLFQRLHHRVSYEGSGLGLAICRKIVESHGGTITADSREGVGSTFTILLPYQRG